MLILKLFFFFIATLWYLILNQINAVNLLTQVRGCPLDVVASNLNNLITDLEEMRVDLWEELLQHCKKMAERTNWTKEFKIKRGRKRKQFFDEEDTVVPSVVEPDDWFKTNVFEKILQCTIDDMRERFIVTNEINSRFNFLWDFMKIPNEELKEKCTLFVEYYNTDVTDELFEEMKQLIIIFPANFQTEEPTTAINVLNQIHILGLAEIFANVVIALRIFLTIPSSVASAERSFSALKRIKDVLRSTMCQDRLSSLGLLSVETELARKLNKEALVDTFIEQKLRKAFINK